MKCKAMNSTKNNARYSVLILLLLSSPIFRNGEPKKKKKRINLLMKHKRPNRPSQLILRKSVPSLPTKDVWRVRDSMF